MTAEGEFALVRQHLEEGLKQTSEWVGEHDLYALLADVAAQQRDLEALHQYAPLAEEMASRYGHTLYQAVAHRAFGVAHRLEGKLAEAEARLTQALGLFHRLDTRWQIGRTYFELGELARARLEAAAAREYFSEALAAFEGLGAAPDVARARSALETVG